MKKASAMAPTVFWCSCLAIASGQEWPREQIPAPRIRDEVKAHHSGIAVWWTGHNGWLIKSDRLIGTDLATEDEARLYQSPISAEELAPLLDVAFITHRHGDHFNRKTARILAEKGKCSSSCRPTASRKPAASVSPRTGSRSPPAPAVRAQRA